jgi:hypothetical protein
VVENRVEERNEEQKEEQIEAALDLHWEKSKEVSIATSSPSIRILETPCEPRAPIPIHDSLSNEKLFENTQKDLPQYAKIQNYLSIGKNPFSLVQEKKRLVFQI